MPTTPDVSRLSDHQLLAGAKELARRERHLNLRIIEHLSEIGRRGLHLRHGYGSLFDYAVKELGFAEGSAYQRLQTLKLSNAFPEVKQDLRNGELTLTAAGYLQSLFDRDQRRQRQWARGQRQNGAPHMRDAHEAGGTPGARGFPGPAGSHRADGPAAGADGGVSAAGAVQPSAAQKTLAAEPGTTPLSAAAKRELIARARGKSTRQVRELIAKFDPELARPRDRLQALGREQWELKAVIGGECRRGLEQLRHWLSHVNPSMDYGELLQRLVADAVAKYDPARQPPRKKRQASTVATPPGGGGSRDKERRKGETGAAEAAFVPPTPVEQRADVTAHQPDPHHGGDWRPAAATAAGAGAEADSDRSRVAHDGRDRVAATAARHVGAVQPVRTRTSPDGGSEASAAARFGEEARTGQMRVAQGDGNQVDATTCAQQRDSRGGRHDAGAAFAQKEGGLAASDRLVASGRLAPEVARTRAIPAAVRRHIWLRDRGRCTYRDPESGRCCGSRHLVQIDHIQPYAMGGSACVENLRLLCSAHNRARIPKRKGRSG